MNTPQKTLTYFLNSILENHKEISIKKSENTPIANITTFEILAPSEFLGQIIGKNGKIIKAIRTLMASSYPKQKFNIQITDEKDPFLRI
ncbi:KH domain-containing protein [Patescibacteria group bacterium]|nr:KH domain-containing protein [Pseudomonadota bacterium]MBU1129762.1 KH domain-containing protein [Patescibacteria group bacterium]